MKYMLTLDERDFYPSANIDNRDQYWHRMSARAVFFDEAGAVALMHNGMHDYYKLPGGGVDDGESIEEALHRELLEETGCEPDANSLIPLGSILEYRDYAQMIQTSMCYIARFKGEKGKPTPTPEEEAEGFQVVWMENIDEALEFVIRPAKINAMQFTFMRMRDTAILNAAKAVQAERTTQ